MAMKHFFILIMTVILLTGWAHAGDIKTVEKRVDQLDLALRQLQNSEIQKSANLANALAVMESLKGDVAQLKGAIETNQHIIETSLERMNRVERDMTHRLESMEERMAIYEKQLGIAIAKISPSTGKETQDFQKALDQVTAGQYLTGVATFRQFMKQYPKSGLRDSAQYWIGECYFSLNDYQKAIQEFQVVIDQYPKSDKVAGSLLKQGQSFSALGMTDEAKLFLGKVIKSFPNTAEANKAQGLLDAMTPPPPPAQPTSAIPLAPGVGISTPKTTSTSLNDHDNPRH